MSLLALHGRSDRGKVAVFLPEGAHGVSGHCSSCKHRRAHYRPSLLPPGSLTKATALRYSICLLAAYEAPQHAVGLHTAGPQDALLLTE